MTPRMAILKLFASLVLMGAANGGSHDLVRGTGVIMSRPHMYVTHAPYARVRSVFQQAIALMAGWVEQ